MQFVAILLSLGSISSVWALPDSWRDWMTQEDHLHSEILRAKAVSANLGDFAHAAAWQRSLQGRILSVRLQLLSALQTVEPQADRTSELRRLIQLRADHQVRLLELILDQIQRMRTELNLRIQDLTSQTQAVHSLHAKIKEDRRRLTQLQKQVLASPLLGRLELAHQEGVAMLQRKPLNATARVVERLEVQIQEERTALEAQRQKQIAQLRSRVTRSQDQLLLHEDREQWFLQDQEWSAFVEKHGLSLPETLVLRRRYLIDLVRAIEKTSCVDLLN